MEAIRISCAGFPTRKTFDEFVSRFGILAPDVLKGRCEEIDACKRILGRANLEGYQVGKTKVFLRAGQMAELDARRTEVLGMSARIIQRKVRSYFARKRFIALRTAAIQIEAVCRGELARHLYQCMRREAACFLAKKAYRALCSSAISIQTGMRAMAARKELQLRKQTKVAIFIQSHCRGYLARSHYLRTKKAAIGTQCAWRGKMARRELRKLKMAAKETGALQAAKSMLEKQVEELTWHLQLEKRMRADLEEAKTQENTRLKSALEEMQLQFDETKELLKKEREAAKKERESAKQVMKAAKQERESAKQESESAKQLPETAPVIQEVSVIDHEIVNQLNAENEQLKALVSSLEKRIDETEKKYEETNRLSEERLKQAMDAESKIIELKTTMQRLEEKLSDIETEDQILRQQALLSAPAGKTSGYLSFKNQPTENGHHEPLSSAPSGRFGSARFGSARFGSASKKFASESMRRSNIERQREGVDTLMNCLSQDLGFSEGKPVAAFTIFKCLVYWKSFEAEKTSVFDRLIQLIGSAIEDETNNNLMAYWLSNTSTLLFLLQHTLKATGSTPPRPPQPTSFFGRVTQSFRSSPSFANISIGGLDGVRQVEAKYPALLFKLQLSAYVEKIY